MAAMMTTMRIGVPSTTTRRSVTVGAFKTGSNKTASSKTLSTEEYVKSLPGITQPFNEPYFDPLNLSKTASIEDMRRWRESEVTHGRVAMLASLGFVVQEQLQDFKLALNFDGGITGPAIGHFQQVEATRPLFWEVLVIAIGLAESFRVSRGWAQPKSANFNQLKDDETYTPGDLGFDPLGLAPEDPQELKDMKTKELNNGRLAMIAIMAFWAQELVSGEEIFEHLALRIEKEVILEVDQLEKAAGLPITPLPENLKNL